MSLRARFNLALLAPLLAETFPPQIVPAYAAAQAMQVLRQKLPGYTYKEATYNATNPADEAVGWEVGLIQDLRRLGPGAEVVLDRYDEQGEPQLIVARPIRIEQQECLVCHSEPSAAPRSMIKVYGAARGFGWPLDQVIGADIVGAPLAVARGAAMHALRSLAWVLAGILVALLLGLNLMFDRIVVSPLARLAKLANDASLGKAADFSGFSGRGDEIGSLAGAFTRTMSGLRRAIGLIDRDGGPKTRDERGR